MASSAFAYDWDDEPEATLAPRVELAKGPSPALAADEIAYNAWHAQQFDRIRATFGEPAKAPSYARLPFRTRAAVVAGGALIGWAVPIAIASALVR